MNEIDEYLDHIVDPTFSDFARNPQSFRYGYLACVAVFHSVDRAAYPNDPRDLAKKWGEESRDFAFVEEIAQHLKHGTRRWVIKSKREKPNDLLVTSTLGLDGKLENLHLHNLYFILRDAIHFIRNKTNCPKKTH
ncbi:hypothetical protein [Gluconobacter kondonii]|uniref:hypothetical protein n=1 Tax=Gluconobacter kondonii TaxID=941463 RepID=UPI001B8DA6FE|nr:hypothetical protein [Gluconobacter kondonii]MBS1057053.1 hypothetical protein [Gluconobacter kondonii]